MHTRTCALALLLATIGTDATAGDATRHLFYLHGRIVQEQQSHRPVSSRFGPYELDAILEAFRERGFEVHSGIRPKGASLEESADRVAADIEKLLESGVAAERVTVVGASMGASIALLAAARLQEPAVRFVTLGACRSVELEEMADSGEKRAPSGRILFIRESSDDLGGPCPPSKDAAPSRSLATAEVVLATGLSHGFLYRPMPEWLDPAVAWATSGELPHR